MKKFALLLALCAAPAAYADHDDRSRVTVGWNEQIIGRIESGAPFTVYLNYNVGTLAAGRPYTVSYNRWNQGFTTSGWSLSRNGYNSQTYYGPMLYEGAISLWGAVFYVDGAGNLYYRGTQYAGVLRF